MSNRRIPRHLFRSRRKPSDAGERFKLAMEQEDILETLARSSVPACLVCGVSSAGIAVWHPRDDGVVGYDGPTELGCPLCQPCKDRSETDVTFRRTLFNKMLAYWAKGKGFEVHYVAPC